MHSIAIASLLAAAATFTSAAPSASNTNANQPRSGYYVCSNNGFRGDCSVDPCAMPWCPDYTLNTYVPIGSSEPLPPVEVNPVPPVNNNEGVCPWGTGYFQSCSNGFRGCCKTDACGSSWCPDYRPYTYEPVNSWKRVVRTRGPAPSDDPTFCPAGTGFFQSCSNGFRGCCKGDACGSSWCPDFKSGTYEPVGTPETTAATTESEVASASWTDPSVCPTGTGFFQSCSNGFRGCCKVDACSLGYCPTN